MNDHLLPIMFLPEGCGFGGSCSWIVGWFSACKGLKRCRHWLQLPPPSRKGGGLGWERSYRGGASAGWEGEPVEVEAWQGSGGGGEVPPPSFVINATAAVAVVREEAEVEGGGGTGGGRSASIDMRAVSSGWEQFTDLNRARQWGGAATPRRRPQHRPWRCVLLWW